MLEIEGDPNQQLTWEARTDCPTMGGGAERSVLCPFRDDCELLEIYVRARDNEEAQFFAEYAAATGKIPRCLVGNPFSIKRFVETISFRLSSLD